MARVRMNITGIDRVLGEISRYDLSVTTRLSEQVKASGKQIVKEAKRRVNKRSGNLRRNIKFKMSRDKLTGWVTLRSNGFYGHFLEFGTVKLSARPFMAPAAEAAKADYQRGVQQAIRGARP